MFGCHASSSSVQLRLEFIFIDGSALIRLDPVQLLGNKLLDVAIRDAFPSLLFQRRLLAKRIAVGNGAVGRDITKVRLVAVLAGATFSSVAIVGWRERRAVANGAGG